MGKCNGGWELGNQSVFSQAPVMIFIDTRSDIRYCGTIR